MANVIMCPLNEQKLQFLGLKDDQGNFINNANVVASLTDSSGNLVNNVGTQTPALNAVTLANIDNTGDYSYTIPATFNPAPGQYVCLIVVTVSATLKDTIYQPVTISKRTS